jgi:AraC-like DNA-binding protein
MKNIWLSAYSPITNTSLYVRSCGHCKVDKDHREKSRIINFSNFYWCVEGVGFFKFDNTYYKVSPGEVWYIPPGYAQDFYPGEEGFHYYWLAIEGNSLPLLNDILKLTPGKKFCGKAPDELFKQIIDGLFDLTVERQLEILGIAFQILFKIAAVVPKELRSEKKLLEEAKIIIEKEFTNPAFNVNSLAEALNMHRTTLYREFKKSYSISPLKYLKSCRLKKAIKMLSQEKYSIKEIAYSCGFASPEYFATVFAAEFGISPSNFDPNNY